MTWQDLIRRALRLSGAIYPGQAYSAELDEIAFQAASMMLSSWSRDGILPPALIVMDKVMDSGKFEYTAGNGGDFPMRPLELDSVTVAGATLGNVRQTLRIETWTNWRNISMPQIEAIPTLITMNPSFPLATLVFYPAPSGGFTVSIAGKFAWPEVIGQRAAEASLPPGFDDAFCDCLADKVADELKIQTDEIELRASTSYKNLILSLPYWDSVQANPKVGVLHGKPVGDPWARFVAGQP